MSVLWKLWYYVLMMISRWWHFNCDYWNFKGLISWSTNNINPAPIYDLNISKPKLLLLKLNCSEATSQSYTVNIEYDVLRQQKPTSSCINFLWLLRYWIWQPILFLQDNEYRVHHFMAVLEHWLRCVCLFSTGSWILIACGFDIWVYAIKDENICLHERLWPISPSALNPLAPFFFLRVIHLCLFREPQPKKPRRPHTTGPNPHQLKTPTPKT